MQNGYTSAGAAPASENVTLAQAIANYWNGVSAYEAVKEKDWEKHGGEEVFIENTYGAPLRVISNWTGKATSISEALEALALCDAENEWTGASEMMGPLLKAVITYLKDVQKERESEAEKVRSEVLAGLDGAYDRVRYVQSFVALAECALVRLDEMLVANGHDLYPAEKQLIGNLCQATEASVGLLDQALDKIGELEISERSRSKSV